ncbi:MutS-related protein [Carboxylicivirga linearis]|uniref:DNA mismatch repair proteins mutS family domain-containing protein n=1 Tax=Carboxylicivirga linearis TaxID=1628157 RepID=A0ABS5JSV2_9BACT|nr:hypothetical protein [Carboxylicivirga linearis]MBS2097954.1 hypothetical protein [Carboxylicivirga linearis]
MIFQYRKKKIEQLKSSFGDFKKEEYNFDLIKLYFKNKKRNSATTVISDRTCADLDFEELFMFLDRTHSKPGQQYLYNQLRNTQSSHNFEQDEKIISQLINDHSIFEIQYLLSKLKHDDGYYIASLFQEKQPEAPTWFKLARYSPLLVIASLILFPYIPQFLFVLMGLIVFNLIVHYWNKKNLIHYSASIPQLIKLKEIAKHLYKYHALKAINKELLQSTKVIDSIKNKMLLFQLEAKVQGEFQALFWFIIELYKILFLLEPIILFSVSKQLRSKGREIEKIFDFVGKTDALLSIASLRHGLYSYCQPQITTEAEIEAQEMYHPLIPDCIPNNLSTHGRSILLTGSNMSGKTTFIRTVGINILTGLTINTCFAKEASFSYFAIESAIRISDDLLNSKSYYLEEVQTIHSMIKKSTERYNLFLLDEIFKGTNTIERIASGKAVLSYLAKNNNLVFVSTHDIELAELLKDEYELYHFCETVDNSSIDFDYQLKKGPLKNRNAIRILEMNDYPKSIIEDAIAISRDADMRQVKMMSDL